MLKRFLLTLVIASVCATTGFAQVVVYDNNQGNAVDNAAISDVDGFVTASNIDDVTLAATTAVTGITWSGSYLGSPLSVPDGMVAAADDNFKISIWRDAGGSPDAALDIDTDGDGEFDAASGRIADFNVGNQTNRTSPGPGSSDFAYSAEIDFTFDGGTSYWLAIVNDTSADINDIATFHQGVSTAGGNALGTFDPVDFRGLIPQVYATDFQLTVTPPGIIPEPTSAALLALGFAGLFTRRRR